MNLLRGFCIFNSHFSASAAISSLSVDTQTLSKKPARWISVKEIPSKVTSSIFCIFFNLIPFEPPRARIKATTEEEETFEKLSWHCTWQRCGEKNDASMSILKNAIVMKSRCDMTGGGVNARKICNKVSSHSILL